MSIRFVTVIDLTADVCDDSICLICCQSANWFNWLDNIIVSASEFKCKMWSIELYFHLVVIGLGSDN